MTLLRDYMDFKPHPYQTDSIDWIISHEYCGLFLPPGLGKTICTLEAFLYLKNAGIIDKLFVIAPLRVCKMVWPMEVQKWGNVNHLSVGIVHSDKKNRKEKVIKQDHDIYVINPEGCQWLSVQLNKGLFSFKTKKWMLIVDESSTYKNSGSMRFKLLKKWLDYFDRRLILTGTPAPNGLEQLWSQIYLVDKGQRLGKFKTQFTSRYFMPYGYNGYENRLLPNAEQIIYSKIDDIILHKSADELDLPNKLYNNIEVELSAKVRKHYDDMKRHFTIELNNEEVTAFSAAAKVSKLKQIANGSIYNENHVSSHIHDEKTKAIEEIVEELGGRPLMVMYEYLHDKERLEKAFPNAKAISGGMSNTELEQVCNAWNNNQIEILLLQPQVGGHGLNLQGSNCHDIVWSSIPYDLELYEQANSRVHRQGVRNAITIHHIIATNTIDSHIMSILKGKDTVQSALMKAMLK
jgi:SNF2 family DNA or RNA helicase